MVERRREFVGAGQGPRASGGDPGGVHHLLGEVLTALELRGGCGRAEHRDTDRLQRIHGAGYQRCLRADDDEVEGFAEFRDGLGVGYVQGCGGHDRCHPGIARRGHHLRDRGVGE